MANEGRFSNRSSRTIPTIVNNSIIPVSGAGSSTFERVRDVKVSDKLSNNSVLPSATETSDYIKILEQGSDKKYVIFSVTPNVSESKNTNYIEISDIRQAASILVFISSPGRSFTITAKLVSRSEQEATKNFKYLHLIKSWGMPSKGSAVDTGGSVIDSEVPKILYLYGYGKQYKGIPMVMKSLSHDFPDDTDYISTASKDAKMPIILTLNMTFQEIRSAEDLRKFNIEKYKTGQLPTW